MGFCLGMQTRRAKSIGSLDRERTGFSQTRREFMIMRTARLESPIPAFAQSAMQGMTCQRGGSPLLLVKRACSRILSGLEADNLVLVRGSVQNEPAAVSRPCELGESEVAA